MLSKSEFANIYEEYYNKLYSYILLRVNNSPLAEDIISQVFFKALKNLKSFDPDKGKISTWLYTITSNTLIDYYRKDEQYENLDDYENSLGEYMETDSDIDFEVNLTKTLDALKRLPAKTQEIITLRIYEELTFVEIAKIIGLSESGVKMSFIRGIEVLKNSINLIIIILFFLR